MEGVCNGSDADHCCYLDGQVCVHLRTDLPVGRRWTCNLFAELGSWTAVHQDSRYLQDVQPYWSRFEDGSFGCGDFPQNIPQIMDNPTAGKCCFEPTITREIAWQL